VQGRNAGYKGQDGFWIIMQYFTCSAGYRGQEGFWIIMQYFTCGIDATLS
jgi:hypothetical protein